MRVFIASSNELKEERIKLKDLLTGESFDPVNWENIDHSIDKKRFQDRINEEHLISSDIVIFIVKSKFGKYTAEEFEIAYKNLGKTIKKIYVYFIRDKDKKENDEELSKVNNFKDFLENEEGKLYIDIEDYAMLENHFLKQIKHIRNSSQTNKKIENRKDLYLSIPNLPNEYLPRDENLKEMKDIILNEAASKVAITGESKKLGIHGMGGIGKSIFAIALAHDEAIREFFKDGIYFIKFGQNPDNEELQKDLMRYFYEDTSSVDKIELKKVLAFKKILLIIDDVWDRKPLEEFDILNNDSKLIITTRKKDLVEDISAKNYAIDILSPKQSLELLKNKVGVIDENLVDLAEKILKRCGYLPLAISMIGALLKGKNKFWWDDILNRLKNSKLEKIKYKNPENEQHQNLYNVIQLSVNYLEDDYADRYLELCIFNDEEKIRLETLQVYFKDEYFETIDILISASLLFEQEDKKGRIHYFLHDLQNDFINSKKKNEKYKYQKLMNNYQEIFSDRWYDISLNDTYFYNKYLDICKILDDELLAKNISQSILYGQSNLGLVLLKRIINLLKLNNKDIACRLLNLNKNSDTLVWILRNLSIQDKNAKGFAKEYLGQEKSNLHANLTLGCLNILGKQDEDVKKFVKEYLNQEKNNLDAHITIRCLNTLGKQDEDVKQFAKEYLNQMNNSLDTTLILGCLNILSKQDEDVKRFAKEYLNQMNDSLDATLTVGCINILSKQDEDVKRFAKEYLNQMNDSLDATLTIKCLNILSKQDKNLKIFAKEYLSQKKDNLDANLTIKCLNILGKQDEDVKKFVKEYLNQEKNSLDTYLTSMCLNILDKQDEDVKKFAKKYLNQEKNSLDATLTITCLKILDKQDENLKKFAKEYLSQKKDSLDVNLTAKCLNILGKEDENAKRFAKMYLNKKNGSLKVTLIREALHILDKQDEDVKKFAKEYLNQEKNNLDITLTTECLIILGKQDEDVKKFAKEYLNQENNNLNAYLTTRCLNMLSIQDKDVRKFAKEYLNQEKDSLDGNLTLECFNILGNQDENAKKFAKEYLAQEKDSLDTHITRRCLNLFSKQDEDIKKFIKEYLAQEKDSLDISLTTECLIILGKQDEDVKKFAKEYLAQEKDILDVNITIKCLNILQTGAKNFIEEYFSFEFNNINEQIIKVCFIYIELNNKDAMNYAKKYIEVNDKKSFAYNACFYFLENANEKEKKYDDYRKNINQKEKKHHDFRKNVNQIEKKHHNFSKNKKI